MPKNYLEQNREILKHYQNPKNFGRLSKSTHKAFVINPLCGDEVRLYLNIKNGHILKVRHESFGCTLCVAGASILSEMLIEKKIPFATKLSEKKFLLKAETPFPPARKSCFLVSFHALKQALHKN